MKPGIDVERSFTLLDSPRLCKPGLGEAFWRRFARNRGAVNPG